VIEREAERRRVLAFDWRGHGRSDPAPGDFGVEEQVADALAVVEASGVERLVPCAASHSGWVAIELRRRLGERVAALAHADWMLAVPSERYLQVIAQLDSDEWEAARDLLFEIWAAGVEAPWLSEALAVMDRHGEEMWRRSGREIGGAYARWESPLVQLAQLEPPVPVLHVYGQPHDPEYLAAQERYSAEHDWFEVRKLEARTHFAMLEEPQAVADAIEALVARAA
jgi:pimeloyl-ACP methyl ester carboxylesterase